MSQYKLAVLGAGAVGKSALTVRFIKGKFVEKYDPTIEDAYRKSIEVDGIACMLDILDTAGQEEYSGMRDAYLKTGQGFVLVYDITSQDSFEKVDELREQIIKSKEAPEVPMILVGNKVDLADRRVVTEEEGASKCEAWGGCPFLESSAKTEVNVDQIFISIVREINKTAPKKESKKGGGCVLL